MTTATKAELNARLASPLTASQLKKTPSAQLGALVEQPAATKAAVETLCDDPNGIPKHAPNPLTAEVCAHAVATYEKGGWDVIVECWSDDKIAQAIVGAKTLAGAIRKLSPTVSIFREQQNEARSNSTTLPRSRRRPPTASRRRWRRGRIGTGPGGRTGWPPGGSSPRSRARRRAAGVDMYLRRFSRAGSIPASARSAVISSSKQKYCTEKPSCTAFTPKATHTCDLPTPGGPCSRTVSALRTQAQVASASMRERSIAGRKAKSKFSSVWPSGRFETFSGAMMNRWRAARAADAALPPRRAPRPPGAGSSGRRVCRQKRTRARVFACFMVVARTWWKLVGGVISGCPEAPIGGSTAKETTP